MLDRLYVKQLAKPIATKGVKPKDFAKDWTELDRRCLGYIKDHIDSGLIHHVENETTSISTSSPDGRIKKDGVINTILNENLRRSTGDEGKHSNLYDTPVFEKRRNNFKKKKNRVVQLKSKGTDKKDDKCHYYEDEWVIDSGASFHVTPHKIFFSNYDLGDFGVAKMGNMLGILHHY
ncbi:hypothetical protein LIER_41059 [Lithospermum erythrorhizon]|uniref:Uncharacterized protein n=1 Tax=Lithospermum erythrorhizon TaxID=34254 RepID=A0AAV3R567_LITER